MLDRARLVLSAMIVVMLGSPAPRALADDGQEQSPEEIFYEVDGLVFVHPFDTTKPPDKRVVVNDNKVPHPPLKFRIVGAQAQDSKQYVVISFFPITSEPASIKAMAVIHAEDTKDNVFYAIAKDEFDQYMKDGFITKMYRRSNCAEYPLCPHLAYGLSFALPFKLRPRIEGHNRQIDTDVTFGGYAGIEWRLSNVHDYYLAAVGSAGLALLPINENTTSPSSMSGNGKTPGVSLAAGVVLRLNDFQLGVLWGRDYAAGDVAGTWIYNTRNWLSFSVGYTLLSKTKPTTPSPSGP